MMLQDFLCPCGTGRVYAACCGPLHRGERAAVTAEALMRSRYAAFSLGEVDYLITTWHPDKRSGLDRRSLAADPQALRWDGLAIRDVVAGGPGDDTGIVEFEASYTTPAASGVLHERSRFVRVDGAWRYVDGATTERERPQAPRGAQAPLSAPRAQGRNEPCACGSGKKAKRCCGGR